MCTPLTPVLDELCIQLKNLLNLHRRSLTGLASDLPTFSKPDRLGVVLVTCQSVVASVQPL